VAAGVVRSSTDGLFGLTVGGLADVLGMSKAGVVGPFGSRHDLQRAVITEAGEMFTAAVIRPSLTADEGLARLRAVIDRWCRYLADGPFPNGCFVTAASCELDGRPGELRDSLQELVLQWREFLCEQVSVAQEAGELDPDIDPHDVVSVLNGIAMSANQELQLLADRSAGRRAKRIMLAYLRAQRC